MDILKSWKNQKGKGTYLSIDSKNDIDVVSSLIFNIGKLNNSIKCFSPESKNENYTSKLGAKVSVYDMAIFPQEPVFLLILLDIDFVPKDVLTMIMAANPHKYLFCTASLVDDLTDYHKRIAPIIRIVEEGPRERKISVSSRMIYNVALDLITDDQKIYDTYTSKMNDIFSFFDGEFININNCYRGDPKKNITADVFRRKFANDNNWNDNLDTSIEYYKEIDRHYNPNSIFEKAKVYFDLMQNRNHFMDEHGDKAYFVHKVVEYHGTKRYLIVCKNTYMADKINNMLAKNNKCKSAAIHGELKPINFRDDSNELILVKSGAKKGQPRDFGAKLQTDAYINWFNNKLINVIVCSNSPQKDIILNHVDVIIYVSPKCLSYEELQKRIRVNFNNNTNILNVYFAGTKDDDTILGNQKGSKYTPKYYYKGDIGKLRFD